MTKPLSPSQFNLYEGCPRAWSHKYIGKHEGKRSQYAEIGVEAAACLETYYKTGVLPANSYAGNIALEALHHLPKYAPGKVFGEYPVIGVPWAGGVFGAEAPVERQMRMDVFAPPGRIFDLKTTSSAFGTIKTEDELRRDTQACVYAKSVDRDEVLCRWVYVTREARPKSRPVDFVITRADIAAAEERSRVSVRQINALAILQPDPNDVPCDLSRCHKYRTPCDYMDVCKRTPEQEMLAEMGGDAVDVKAEVDKFLEFSPPPVQNPVYTPSNFPLPMWGAKQVQEHERMGFLKYCLDKGLNPFDPTGKLGLPKDDVFMAQVAAIFSAAPTEASPPAPEAVIAAPATQPAEASPAETPPPSAPPPEAPPEPAESSPAPAIARRGPGRPPGAKNNKTDLGEAIHRIADSLEAITAVVVTYLSRK